MILLVFIFITCVMLFSAIYYGTGPNSTPKKALRIIVETFPQDVKVIYDLGTGFGLSSLYFAKKFPKAKVVGIEASLVPFIVAKILSLFQKNLIVSWKNFYDISLEDADVVYCYLFRGAMKKLKNKFEKELRKGALVVSYTFSLHKPCAKMYDLGGFYQNKLYCYDDVGGGV